ncbi:uncharacterized protein LOC107003768 [Solanum pennellii]|uniref:Uncharacterized protein LOC107003768 n=1 Tax=Solanum pennellii TaxID=28526 RepID=A0ABM1FIZ4_SOLPN|nr:uncharacterized protein LOC107003768 [Solanum pennellii]
MWNAINLKKNGELISMDMIFIDEKGNLMHGIIRKNQVNRLKDKLNEGSVFIIKNFIVVESIGGYRPVQNSLKIIFFASTAIKNLSEDIVEIPINGFEFINPDVIDSRVNKNIVLSGEVSFSTTYASKIYVNLDIDYIRSLAPKFSTMSTEAQIIKSSNVNSLPREEEMFLNRMDIKELLEAEWSSELQEYIVTVKNKVIEIYNYFGWYYISCNVCSKKIEPTNSIYRCHNCNKDCKFPLVRYKMHLKVTDRTADTTFILFNAVAEKLLDTSAHINKLTTTNNDVPVQVQSLCGKEFVFKLRLNHYNLKEGLENFTISKLWISDDNLEVQYKLRKEEKGRTYPKMKPTQRSGNQRMDQTYGSIDGVRSTLSMYNLRLAKFDDVCCVQTPIDGVRSMFYMYSLQLAKFDDICCVQPPIGGVRSTFAMYNLWLAEFDDIKYV